MVFTFDSSSVKRLRVMPWFCSSCFTWEVPSEKMPSIRCSTEIYSSWSFSAVFSATLSTLPVSGEA